MVFINFFEGILYFYFSFYILILCYKSRAIDPNYLLHFCNSNDSTNSARTNLAQLLSSLSNAARNNANGFFNSTTAARNSSTLYGLFLCRGDVPPSICQTCVEIAADESAGLCPEGMDFIVWYEECMLRYSDQWFFGSVEGSPKVVRWTNQEVRDIDRFDRILAATVEDIAKAASSEIRAKKFATREADIGGSSAAQKVYALAECVPALSGNDCYRCLRMAIDEFPRLLIGKIEGKSLLPSCGVRYRMSPFYNQIHPPPSPRPPPG